MFDPGPLLFSIHVHHGSPLYWTYFNSQRLSNVSAVLISSLILRHTYTNVFCTDWFYELTIHNCICLLLMYLCQWCKCPIKLSGKVKDVHDMLYPFSKYPTLNISWPNCFLNISFNIPFFFTLFLFPLLLFRSYQMFFKSCQLLFHYSIKNFRFRKESKAKFFNREVNAPTLWSLVLSLCAHFLFLPQWYLIICSSFTHCFSATI